MAQTSAGAGPIPPAKKDDSEDVAWALSTAEAMYARGDRGDALKWLRRAAESASEAQADDRALELAKAAADLASSLGPITSVPPAAAPLPPPPPAPSVRAAPLAPSSRPVPPAPAASSSRPVPPTPPSTPSPVGKAPSAPARPPPPPAARPSGRAISPFAPTAARTPEQRRAARRSRPDISFSRPGDDVTQSMPTGSAPVPPAPDSRRARRASRPAAEEVTPAAQAVVPPSQPTPFPDRQTRPVDVPRTSPLDEMDSWPTQSLMGDDLADPPDEKTRIGVPAYEASARLATESAESPPARITPTVLVSQDPALRPSQAVRVVVWRAADGVHVAPHGTRVAAISVDAVLVALDPAADLAAWLTGK